MQTNEAARIAQQMHFAQNGASWHGPNLEEILDGINAEQAASHPVEGAHSIWELVLHINAWRDFGWAMLTGQDNYDPDVDMSLNFPPTPAVNAENWQQSQRELQESCERLAKLLAEKGDELLSQKVPSRKYDFYKLLHGIVQHDLYHAGQIILLKKMLQV
ncbi:MAG: DinB family protein [Bacteroidota bacterium]